MRNILYIIIIAALAGGLATSYSIQKNNQSLFNQSLREMEINQKITNELLGQQVSWLQNVSRRYDALTQESLDQKDARERWQTRSR